MNQGLSNVPWRKRAFWPGTKYVFLDQCLGILGALCMGKGGPLVRYLCTTWESLHMFFTEMCPSSGTNYVSLELFLSILRGPGEGRGGAPGTVPSTFAKSRGHFTEGMFEKCRMKATPPKLNPPFFVILKSWGPLGQGCSDCPDSKLTSVSSGWGGLVAKWRGHSETRSSNMRSWTATILDLREGVALGAVCDGLRQTVYRCCENFVVSSGE